MFSALKFIAAGVIVALFGGFLLTGVLTTQQGDEVVPAAVTVSPTPMATDELLAGMVTERLEPGVVRVIYDGIRDVTRATKDDEAFGGVLDGNIVAGLDGSVWLFWPDRFFRLGDADQAAPGWELYRRGADIEVAPDGHVWLVAQREDGSADLVTFVDRLPGDEDVMIWGDPAWPEYADLHYLGVEVEPDGTVRTAWFEPYGSSAPNRSKITVGTFWGGWVPLPTVRSWPGQRHDDPVLEASGHDIWLADPGDQLRSFEEAGWRTEDSPFVPGQLDVGLDGTLWIQATDWDQEVCGLRLARFDGTDWASWDRHDGVPDVGSVLFYGGCQEGVHAAAPDGSVWLAPLDFMAGRECSGIANFDGTTWIHHLDGLCVYDAAIAPDGAVWLQAGEVRHPSGDQDFGPVGTYVITPEAVVAKAASAASSASVGGTVSITVRLGGASGSQVAALLFPVGQDGRDGLGSYMADVTADPFDVTGEIREGSPWLLREPPLLERPAVVVPAGDYRLLVWVAKDLGPYNEWIPGAPIEAVCSVDFTVNEGTPASVSASVTLRDDPSQAAEVRPCDGLQLATTSPAEVGA